MATRLPDPEDLLMQYLSIDSSHPSGGETLETAEFLQSIFDRYDIDSFIFTAKPYKNNIRAKLPGKSDSPVVLLHHMDVVGGRPDQFDPQVRYGEIFGRGAIDDKGLGVIHLLSFLRLARKVREGLELSRPVWFVAVCDEEIGGKYGGQYVADLLFGDKEFETPPVVLDEGGFWVSDIFENPICNIAVAEKSQAVLKLTFSGSSGHGSVPPRNLSDSAHFKAAVATKTLKESDRPLTLGPASREFIKLVKKLKFGRFPIPLGIVARLASYRNDSIYSITHDTIAFTREETETDVNVVPSEVVKYLDARLLPESSLGEVLRFVRSALAQEGLSENEDYELEVVENRVRGGISDIDSSAFNIISETVQKHSPETRVSPYQCPGITDSRFFRNAGCECYGIIPALLTQDHIDNIHGENERIPIDSLRQGVNIMEEIVTRISC